VKAVFLFWTTSQTAFCRPSSSMATETRTFIGETSVAVGDGYADSEQDA
jgi:hypothetical protein